MERIPPPLPERSRRKQRTRSARLLAYPRFGRLLVLPLGLVPQLENGDVAAALSIDPGGSKSLQSTSRFHIRCHVDNQLQHGRRHPHPARPLRWAAKLLVASVI